MMKLSDPALILASTSPYRRQLLERLQVPFSCVAPKTDESPYLDEAPEDLARRLADQKALDVSKLHPDALVLGSDQVPALGAQTMNKPGSIELAEEQLRQSSGQSVRFYTAVTLVHNASIMEQRCVLTIVKFRHLSQSQITDYVRRERPLDCAGSFRWEGLGISLFTALQSDDPTALEGLPLIATCDMLTEYGVNILKTVS